MNTINIGEPTISASTKKDISSLKKQVTSIDIKTIEDANNAGKLVFNISELQKSLEDQRKLFTQPLNVSLKNINAFFKKFSAPLEELDKEIRGKLLEFEKSTELETIAIGFIHFTKREDIKVIDISKVPREYLTVDMAKVKAAIKEGKTIKGIAVVTKKGVSL